MTVNEHDLWWYSIDGSTKEKASHQHFSEFVHNNKLPESTLVWKQGMPDWILLADLPDSSLATRNMPFATKYSSPEKTNRRFAIAALTLFGISITVAALLFRNPPLPHIEEQASINTQPKTDTTPAPKKSDTNPSADQSAETSKRENISGTNHAPRLWKNPISGVLVEIHEPWQFNQMKSDIGDVLISLKSDSTDRSLYLISKSKASVQKMADKYAAASNGGLYEMPKLYTEGAWQIVFIKCAPEFCQKAPAFNVFFKRSDWKEAQLLYAGAFRKSSADRSALVSVCGMSSQLLASSGLGKTDWLTEKFPLLCHNI